MSVARPAALPRSRRPARPGRPVSKVTAEMSHPAVLPLAFPPRPAPAPAAISGALQEIEGIGWVLAEAAREGGGLDGLSCDGLAAALRRVYRVVRALRAG